MSFLLNLCMIISFVLFCCFRFRLIARAMAAFLLCQMPVDTSQSTLPRITPNAPGHIKDPLRSQPGANLLATPTKQADQVANSLEGLLNNKNYSHLKEYVSYSLVFLHDLNHSLLNCAELLVYLCTALYPNERFLDTLRILQAWFFIPIKRKLYRLPLRIVCNNR